MCVLKLFFVFLNSIELVLQSHPLVQSQIMDSLTKIESIQSQCSGQQMHIAVMGIIGAGKTTLAKELGELMGLDVYYEPVQKNPYLAKFYKDQKKWGFQMQIYLLNKRFVQQQQIIWSGRGGVQDRSIYEDSIFAKILSNRGAINPLDYQTYIELFDNISRFMKRPNLLVYLDVNPSVSLERVKKRDRQEEKGTTLNLSYLEDLKKGYQQFIPLISKTIPVLILDWNKPVSPKIAANAILETINKKISNVIRVDLNSDQT